MDPLAPQFQIALPGIPQVGDVIAEKFRVEAVLGVGGMGVVLSARHLQLGQVVAIKVLTVNEDKQQDAVERFLREGRAAAGLSSDHVVRIYDVGQLGDGTPFMVMERLLGRDLAAELAARGPLSVEDAVEYVAQAAMAIAEAHEAGVIHRDLKPSNLFLTHRSDGTACIKVLDFGISKQLSMFQSQTLRGDLTQTRQVMGSPAYMSPEQVRDARHVDHRTDIWALGTTLYELLTRRVAFDAETLPAVCAAIAADPPTPLEVHRGDVPEQVAVIVMRCLEKPPAKRYQSARALLTALRTFQGRSDQMFSSRDAVSPPTAASVEVAQVRASEPAFARNIVESGARSVESMVPSEAQEHTLLSGPIARSTKVSTGITKAKVSTATGEVSVPVSVVSHRRRGRYARFILIAVLGLCAAVTTVLLVQAPPPVPVTTRFNLRIASEPTGATVFEGERWLGETPLVLPIEKATVSSQIRHFTLRKFGYLEARVTQGDSSQDLQVQVNLTVEPSIGVKPVSRATDTLDKAAGETRGVGPEDGTNRPLETQVPPSGLRSRSATGRGHVPTTVKNTLPSDIRVVR